MRPNSSLVLSLLWVIALQLEHVITVPHPPGETLIKGCHWFGGGPLNNVQDGNLGTVYSPPPGPNPYFYAKCPGVFNITTIQIVAQNNNNGLNETFQLHTNAKFFNPCRFNRNKDWKLCKGDAVFRTKGEVGNFKCAPDATMAQYVMFSRESPDKTSTVRGPFVADIRLYGIQVGNSTISPEPRDEKPIEPFYKAIRRAIFENVTELWYEPSYNHLDINQSLDDVVVAWGWDVITGVAVERGKGHIVAMMGKIAVEEIHTAPYLVNFRRNIMRFLGQGENSKFVFANQSYSPGDVVGVMRHLKFDMDQIADDVLEGKIGLLIGFVGIWGNPVDNTTKLMDKLGIPIRKFPYRMGNERINPSAGINTMAYVPVRHTLKYITDSWQGMCTTGVPRDFAGISHQFIRDLYPDIFQKQLRKMLLKWRPYFEDRAPCDGKPFKWDSGNRLAWINYNYWSMAQFTENPLPLPGTDIFPGVVGPNEKPVKHRLILQARIGTYFNPTGVYINPGTVFKWKVLNHSHDLGNTFFVFGCQKDNVGDNNPWNRWPRYIHTLQITEYEGSYASPVGGVLFLRNWNSNSNVTLELENVYRHPWFDLSNKSSVDDWDNERKRYNGVPWMSFIGDTMHTCLQTKDIVKLNKEDMSFVTNYLDNVVKILHNFRGSVYENHAFEVFATDVQLIAGWGHSGVPIMGYLSWHQEITDVAKLKKQSAVGITHELGHNLQNGAVTFRNGGEVTNNVYHFPVRQHLLNLPGYGPNALRGLDNGQVNAFIRTWKGNEYVGVNEGYYNWLGYIFGEGILVNMWHLGWHNRNQLKTEEDKVNFWLSNLCNMTEYNLIPWQELWKFPINKETRALCAQYTCFFPDDFITQREPEIVNRQLAKCTGPVDRKPKKQIESKHDVLRGLNTQRPSMLTFF